MATVLTAAQDLRDALSHGFEHHSELYLGLSFLFAITFGFILGRRGRRVVRVVKTVEKLVEPEPDPEELKTDEPPPALTLEDVFPVMLDDPQQALLMLADSGFRLDNEADKQALAWQSEVLDLFVGVEVVEALRRAATDTESAAHVELAQASDGAILFFDLRGFTNATEHLGGAYLMKLLNVYLGQMGVMVAAAGGTVDKFIGDCVMATFGVLRPLDNPVQSAAECAQDMIERMVHINAQLKERGLPRLTPSVGISSGEMVAGTLGGGTRRSFTVIGGCVNRAARLESATRKLGVDLLMDRKSYERLDNPPWGMKVHHRLKLRGVDEAIIAWSWTRPKVG